MRLLLLLSFLSLPLALSAEDSLREAKQELHQPKPSAGSTASAGAGTHHQHVDHDDADDVGGWFFGALIGGLVTGIGYGVYHAFIWHSDPPQIVGARPHPYADNAPGYYAPFGNDQPGRILTGDLSADGGWIDDDLQRYTVGGRLNISAFVLRTEWSRYLEERADGGHDSLNLGTIDAELGITMGRYARLGLGLGATITHDALGTEAGPCVAVGLDVFPVTPVILSGALTYAKVGDYDTEILTWRATIGGIWKRYELYGGWQSTSIGSVVLDGPTAGLRLWF